MNNDTWKYDTQAIRAGSLRSEFGENSEAIFLTSSYVFDSSAQAAARFAGTEPGNIYSRFTNPTVTMFQDRLAAMEGSEACVATSSGMSAILAIIMGLCSTGEHIVASRSIFGTTVQLFSNILKRWGLEITFVSLTNLNEWEDAIQKNTKLFFVETPSNPLTEVTDIKALSKIAHQKDIKLIVDNCFCSPALQRPLLLGADIIIHSATKYLDGQGRCLGGAVLADKKTIEPIYQFLRSAGPTMSAFNAWVFLKGLETLSVRMDAHSKNALHLASWLESQPQIDRVYYPGLASHPQHKLALTQQKTGGAIVSFEVKGGQKEAWSLIDSTRLISITANLGDVKSTITHPTTTTHSRVSPEERQKAGIKDNLVRIAVGLEDIEDLKADLSSLSR
ncbi:O-succinylhomoserine sulfhydrylase [Candidatus Methylopumilus planktonicus]|jgi:O-succinylhomoserine sulfhydrylase|uniref:O-succinylhomoserine sulfhydrylase n=1 Tax=Candidatus Methylopumilus TaxID=1679002 RepID=UPI00111D4760|nr:O-succinylhomoserine sulfhydrylase [Candidatus Methylopumilus planktonicus]QDD00282.1 O-succinylhomoserine sulfhydrylase [Candidatus Methylopumilus planktonicus]QDD01605.1 O-succinylhomoserine sulfhydrylase [Candidatus Methylopumilus planktonicus]